jgi:hypothetical protein
MTLRFQKDDEVDREVKATRRFPWWTFILVFALIGVVHGIDSWVTGRSLAKFGSDLGEALAFSLLLALAEGFLAPFYKELRFRAKEIDGKVSAIEETVTALGRGLAELREQLRAIQFKLDELEFVENAKKRETR